MKARPTIFISGVSHEFSSFRDAVENEVEKKGCFAENQPNFHTDHATVEEMLRRRLHDADAVIHLAGFRFGAEPNARLDGVPRRSYTQMEFDIARELKKPVYVFLSADAAVRQAPKLDEQLEEAEATALQLAHRTAIQQTNYLYYFFKDQAELCKLVAEIPIVQAEDFKADISRIIKYAPTDLIGREAEMQLLNEAWLKVRRAETPRHNIVTFVALGGEGKTSLVAKWAAELAAFGWQGCDAVFAWSFYSQGTREQVAASSDLFLKAALDFFGDADDQAFAASNAGAYEKGERLARVVGRRRCLLILDGLEPLQYAPSAPTPGELKDQGVAALLKKLAADNRGLCVVTTRYALPDLRAFLKQTVREEPLLRLSRAAGVKLLKDLGVRGSELRNLPLKDGDAQSEQVNEFEKLVEDVKGHALTLTLLGGFLRDAHGGDIRKRALVTLAEADAESDHPNHAAHVMDAYVNWFENGWQTADETQRGRRALAVLRLLGLFDRPATADCLSALWQDEPISGLTEPFFTSEKKWLGLKQTLQPISEAQRNVTLKRLETARLLTVKRDAAGALVVLDAHPHLREYFSKQLREQQPEVWRAAHRRIYEYLCATTKEGDQPTLEDLQPLYQAVAHGCYAELKEDVLRDVLIKRIFQGTGDFGNYSMFSKGAIDSDLAALAHFFDSPWKLLAKSIGYDLDVWTLSAVAYRLRAVGRLTEAVEPIIRALTIAKARQDNWQAAIRAAIACETTLILGEIATAIGIGEEGVKFANLQDNEYWRLENRSTLASALLQSGDLVQAQLVGGDYLFAEEQSQANQQNRSLQLHSKRGFHHCEIHLACVERAVWKIMIAQLCSGEMKPQQPIPTADLLLACQVVSGQATRMLQSDKQYGRLIDFGLHYLTLGRVLLYEAILGSTSLEPCRAFIDQAVSGLRRAGTQNWIPAALLTRAWFRSCSGVPTGPDSAQTDLDEAWEIASRGPMRLFMADIHLYRARLFGPLLKTRDEGGGRKEDIPYPWVSVEHDLAEAERLIRECGYGRRLEELADAKRALLG